MPASRYCWKCDGRFCALIPTMGSRRCSIMPCPHCSKARIRSAASCWCEVNRRHLGCALRRAHEATRPKPQGL